MIFPAYYEFSNSICRDLELFLTLFQAERLLRVLLFRKLKDLVIFRRAGGDNHHVQFQHFIGCVKLHIHQGIGLLLIKCKQRFVTRSFQFSTCMHLLCPHDFCLASFYHNQTKSSQHVVKSIILKVLGKRINFLSYL